MLGLIGKKLNMTQIFDDNGNVVPVTVVVCGPCYVIQKKTKEKEGYNAIQLGFEDKKKPNRPYAGHFKNSKVVPKRKLTEFRVEDIANFECGQKLTVELFKEEEKVRVTGFSKGRGFSGVVKKCGYSGGPESHGSMSHAVPGSIGGTTDPGRVWKGKGLPGRYGGDKTSIKNLTVVKVDIENNRLFIKGAVPGARNGYLLIKKT